MAEAWPLVLGWVPPRSSERPLKVCELEKFVKLTAGGRSCGWVGGWGQVRGFATILMRVNGGPDLERWKEGADAANL